MGLTVADAMKLSVMQQARLVAGSNGLARQIRWVTIVEVIEDVSRLQEGEFLITTAYGWEADPDLGRRLLEGFAAQGLSGVAIQTGFYLAAIPQPLVELADKLGLPVFELPSQLNFSMVTRELLEQVINEQFRALEYSENVHQKLIHLALSGAGLDALAQELGQLTHACIQVYNAKWRVETRQSYPDGDAAAPDFRRFVMNALLGNAQQRRELLERHQTIRLHFEPPAPDADEPGTRAAGGRRRRDGAGDGHALGAGPRPGRGCRTRLGLRHAAGRRRHRPDHRQPRNPGLPAARQVRVRSPTSTWSPWTTPARCARWS